MALSPAALYSRAMRVALVVVVACGGSRVEEFHLVLPPSDPRPRQRERWIGNGDLAPTARPTTHLLVVLPFAGEPMRGGEVTERFRAEAGTSLDERLVLTARLIVHRECGPDPSDDCLARVGLQRRFEWVLFGAVKSTAGRRVVDVRLISTGDTKATRHDTFDVATGSSLPAAAHAAWIRVSAK